MHATFGVYPTFAEAPQLSRIVPYTGTNFDKSEGAARWTLLPFFVLSNPSFFRSQLNPQEVLPLSDLLDNPLSHRPPYKPTEGFYDNKIV